MVKLSEPYTLVTCLGLIAASIAYPSNQGASYNSSLVVDSQNLNLPYPYEFPVFREGHSEHGGQFPMQKCHGLTLEEATIDQLQEALSKGKITTVKLVLCYLQRIYQTDEYLRYGDCSLPFHIHELLLTRSDQLWRSTPTSLRLQQP